MGTKKFMKNYGWGCIGRTLVQLIPLFLFVLLHTIFMSSLKIGSLHTMIFHRESGVSIFGMFFVSIVVYVITMLVSNFFFNDLQEVFGWLYSSYGYVNRKKDKINREEAKERVKKARLFYKSCCSIKYVFVLALFLPDIGSHVVESLVPIVIFFVYYLIMDIYIGIYNNYGICPVCFHAETTDKWDKSWRESENFVKYYDEKIGTLKISERVDDLKIGESEVNFYKEKPTEYKKVTEYRSGKCFCSVCGRLIGSIKDESSYTYDTQAAAIMARKHCEDLLDRYNNYKDE